MNRLGQSGLKRTWKVFRDNWTLYLLVLPAIIYVLLFNYMPMYGMQIAFRNFRPARGITGSPWVGFDQFMRFFMFPNFWMLIRNTLTISLWSIATFPLAVILALMINEVQNGKFKENHPDCIPLAASDGQQDVRTYILLKTDMEEKHF